MVYQAGSQTETTYYLGGLMEKVVSSAGTDYRHYIPGPEEMIGIYSRASSGTNQLRYLLPDYQGSVDAIIDSAGANPVYTSFTPYGVPREAIDWGGAGTTPKSITRQGYTFQTVLGRMGLNHMNGRVQDAISGTFMSPDPFVPDPMNTQAFNRYAYVYNNPMSYTDPSGFCPLYENCGVISDFFGGDWGSYLMWIFGGSSSYHCYNTFEACARGLKQEYVWEPGRTPAPAPDATPTPDLSARGGLALSGPNRAVSTASRPNGLDARPGATTVGGACSSIGGGDGATAARGGCYFVNDPNISFETKRDAAVGGLLLMTGGTIALGDPLFAALFELSVAPTAIADGMPAGAGSVRVGRWMNEAEYSAMLRSNRVQDSQLTVTSVSSPPNPAAWIRQTRSPIYAEFDVPASAVRPLISDNAKIYGPNSIFAKKYGITEMPSARNIVQTVCKIPMKCAAR